MFKECHKPWSIMLFYQAQSSFDVNLKALKKMYFHMSYTTCVCYCNRGIFLAYFAEFSTLRGTMKGHPPPVVWR